MEPQKIFMSYKFTGVPFGEIEAFLKPIHDMLLQFPFCHYPYCNLWDTQRYIDEKFTTKQIMKECFAEIEKSDALLALINSPELSTGMVLEIGYALAHDLPVILVCHRDAYDSLNTLASVAKKVIIFDDPSEIRDQLKFMARFKEK